MGLMILSEWTGFGPHKKGPDRESGNLYCVGGCGGVIGVFPPNAKMINCNLYWCHECSEKFRTSTGEDPCFPRKDREWQSIMLWSKNSAS